MADVTSEITVDTNEWVYVDSSGIGHKVTNAQTFNLEISDDDASDVQYNIAPAQTVTTDDGYTITSRPQVTGGNIALQVETMADATTSYVPFKGGINGEFAMSISTDNVVQIWKVTSLAPSNVDYNAAGTIAATFEDQFGNTMSWVAGMTVAQAA